MPGQAYDLSKFLAGYIKLHPEYSSFDDEFVLKLAFKKEPQLAQLNWKIPEAEIDLPSLSGQKLYKDIDLDNLPPGVATGMRTLTPKGTTPEKHFGEITKGDQLAASIGYGFKQLPMGFANLVTTLSTAISIDPGGSGVAVVKEMADWRHEKMKDLQSNVEIQALMKWNQDEPVRFSGDDANWYHPDILARSLADVIPSLTTMAVATLATGGGFLPLALSSGVMEAGIHSMEVFDTAREEGLSIREANEAAAFSSMIYGSLAGIEEATSFGWFLKWSGLRGVGQKALRRSITKAVLGEAKRVGGWQTFMKTASVKTAGALTQPLVEGAQEYTQYMTEQMVEWAVLSGYGANPDEALQSLTDVAIAHYWDEEAQRSLHAGLVAGGGLGIPGAGIGIPVEFGKEKKKQQLIRDINQGLKDAGLSLEDKKGVADVVSQILTSKGDVENILGSYKVNKEGKEEKVGVSKGEKESIFVGEKLLKLARENPSDFLKVLSTHENQDAIFSNITKAVRELGNKRIIKNTEDLAKAINELDAAEALENIPDEILPEYSEQEPTIAEEPTHDFEPDLSDAVSDVIAREALLDFEREPEFYEPTPPEPQPTVQLSEATDEDIAEFQETAEEGAKESIKESLGITGEVKPSSKEGEGAIRSLFKPKQPIPVLAKRLGIEGEVIIDVYSRKSGTV